MPPDAKVSALKIMAAEHAAFDAALAAIIGQMGLTETGRFSPDPARLDRTLGTIATFMGSFHHPKEDDHLFKALRERTREADEELAVLQHDHARDAAAFMDLRLALSGTRPGASSQFRDFAILMKAYAATQLEHMRIERDIVLPIAARVLRPSDWTTIDAAFRSNRDPMYGATR